MSRKLNTIKEKINGNEKVVAGVAAKLSSISGIPVILIRLAIIAVGFFSYAVTIGYIIAAIILNGQKMKADNTENPVETVFESTTVSE